MSSILVVSYQNCGENKSRLEIIGDENAISKEEYDGCNRKTFLIDYSRSDFRYQYGFENAIPLKDAVNGFYNPDRSYDVSTDYDYTRLELNARFVFVRSNQLDYSQSEIYLSMPPLDTKTGKNNKVTSLIRNSLERWAEIRGDSVYISITDRLAKILIKGTIDNEYFHGIISYENLNNAYYRPSKAVLGEFKFASCVVEKNY